jgi:UDPglucose--hexose-1-phosphate uridylyltransferase
MTPPAVLVYLSKHGDVQKERDQDGFRHKNWLTRCVPNLYPAFTPFGKLAKHGGNGFRLAEAIGHHEVVIESPNHDEHPATARLSQLIHLINTYIDRLEDLVSKPYVKYVSIFRNHGVDAGASLSHAHTQIIATPIVPFLLKKEIRASKAFWDKNKECVFCSIMQKESKSPRLVWENSHYMVLAPWASVHACEFWIFPKKHQSTLTELSKNEIEELAKTLRLCFGGLKRLLNDPPYNFGFHIAPNENASRFYHWHLEVYPKLAIWAGFEKSTGIFINTLPPEDAATSLRESIQAETKTLEA